MRKGLMPMSEIDVSVVMCTHNRAAMLRDALRSLAVQETGGTFRYEIVVVHTGSPDGTLDVIAEACKTARVPIVPVHQPHRGLIVARNRGLEAARGQWIATFDDDQIAEPDWLQALLRLAHEKKCRNVGGAVRLRLPDGCNRPLTDSCRRTLGASVAWDRPRPYTRKECPGAGNQMFHRSVLDEVGNYDERCGLRGEDCDLYRRMRNVGIESWYTPDAIVHHVIPPTRLTDAFFRQISRVNGWTAAQADRKAHGTAFLFLVTAVRLGHAASYNVARLLKARIQGRDDVLLEARMRRWKAAGYTRAALHSLAPGLISQYAPADGCAPPPRSDTRAAALQAVGAETE
jgi:GT2 family glycosyltransferase